ncbi:MAG: ABC transporter substrate-binding protein [Candidatus Tectomicrobia bacterium]|uniref:ABC transporter substrate-binding protein n=1 Tax=Tectimicrobiota bacterium TaxID=2528274 RepID=A0A932M0N8_UNCTE|nr:ABC transporter substrate-binding protein [Candidatus Tectomicrobia bacterium]
MICGMRPKKFLWAAVVAWLAIGIPPAMGQEKAALTFGDNPYGYAANAVLSYTALYEGIVKPERVDFKVLHAPIDANERLMMAGQRDLGTMSFLAYFTARARGVPLVAVAVEQRLQQTERTGTPANALYVRVAAGVDNPKKLEGKKVGLPLLRSASSLYTQAILKDRYGVDLSRITWVDKPPPILYQILQSGEIDAAVLYGEPSYRALREPSLKVSFVTPDTWEAWTGTTTITTLIVAKTSIVEKYPKAVKSVLSAMQKSREYGLQNTDQILDIAAKKLGLSKEHLKQGVGTAYFAFEVSPKDRESLKLLMKYAVELKMIDKELDPSTLFFNLG